MVLNDDYMIPCLHDDDDVLMLITVLEELALMWVITNCMFVCLLFDDYMMFDDVDYSFRGACLDVGHYLRD